MSDRQGQPVGDIVEFWQGKVPLAVARLLPLTPSSAWLRPSGHSPEEIRSWIVSATQRLGVSATWAAKEAGLAPSTINRFLSGRGKNQNISATTIYKLQDIFISVYNVRVTEPGFIQESEALPKVISVPVVMHVESGVQVHSPSFEESEIYHVSVPTPLPFLNYAIFGVEVRGEGAVGVYPRGSVLICVTSFRMKAPQAEEGGDHFVFLRRKGEKVESAIYECAQDPRGSMWLLSLGSVEGEASDPESSIFLGKPGTMIASDLLGIGYVIGSYRPNYNTAATLRRTAESA